MEKSITINKITPNRRASQDKPTTSASDNIDNKKKVPVLNRNRYALIYEDEDDTTSDPKLEKLINADKERIEKEKADRLAAKKKRDTIPDSKQEKNNEKMASSADKFKQFLDAGNSNGSKSDNEQPDETKTPTERNDKTQNGNAESSPSTLSQASNVSQGTPSGTKRRSTAIDSSADSPMKRARNTEDDDENDEVSFNTILRGTTFVISGIQNPERARLREQGINIFSFKKYS